MRERDMHVCVARLLHACLASCWARPRCYGFPDATPVVVRSDAAPAVDRPGAATADVVCGRRESASSTRFHGGELQQRRVLL